jgi:hypothetical protein
MMNGDFLLGRKIGGENSLVGLWPPSLLLFD